MKGIKLLLAVCLAPLTFGGAVADDNTDAARAAVRRTSASPVTVTRKKNTDTPPAQNAQTISRTTNLSAKTTTTPENERTAVSPRDSAVSTSNSQRSQSVVTRTQPAPQIRTRTASLSTGTRTANTTQSRSATTRATTTSTPRVMNTARTATTRAALSRAATKNIARAANDNSATTARTGIMLSNAKKCREVYYDCMDEFCANKDAVLKRCACSARTHEFDSTKNNLANVEDKMLEFNQRLLTVNMDKEDAAALYSATEGELAFNTKDTSESKKMLDEIAKKLNTSFDDSNFDRNLSPISLSLNTDAAFDNIDSMLGAETTLKSGTELYTAALPVCRDMAREVCTDDNLAIAESGYQMLIEQDCNTVAKSYQAQVDQARERVREGSALLDMSRLDIHQKRNSDDILTCKKKMLDMLTDSSVCGNDMGQCLDVTGKYIDPSTGEAFLTEHLSQLNSLITRPTGDQTWTDAPGNNTFVSYLNSKKVFLEPAMENCQDIADTVWNEFLEDALAQIKLAQEAKLEDMRQSCTAITTKCLSETAKSLSDFDARALSVFGIKADKTVNAMCSDVTNACNALLKSTDESAGENWIGGMTEITNAKTYETILATCREVGRACIVQTCSSAAGNFGLCESIQSSVNRKSIINRTACWDQVYNCVADAGAEKINEIMTQLGKGHTSLVEFTPVYTDSFPNLDQQLSRVNTIQPAPKNNLKLPICNADGNLCFGRDHIIFDNTAEGIPLNTLKILKNDFYNEVYNTSTPLTIAKMGASTCTASDITNTNTNITCIYDICDSCNSSTNLTQEQKIECYTCRIAEQIWGNCEAEPKTSLGANGAHNKILQPKDDKTTLLWWFAQNTGTSDEPDSCRDTTCPSGYTAAWQESNGTTTWSCTNETDNIDISQQFCDESTYQVTDTVKNCCPTDVRDGFDNCLPAATTANIDFGTVKQFSDNSVTGNYNLYIKNNVSGTTIPMSGTSTLGNINYTVVATWTLDELQSIQTYPSGQYALICVGSTSGTNTQAAYPSGQGIECNGTYVVVNLDNGLYFTPGNPSAKTNMIDAANDARPQTPCHYSLTTSGAWQTEKGESCPINPDNWKINITY